MNKLTHQARVEEEIDQLQARLKALRDFIASPTYQWITPVEQQLLAKQEKHMADYLAVLYERINHWQRMHP